MKSLFVKPFIIYLLKFGALFSFFYFGTLLIIGLSSEDNYYSLFVANYLDYITPLRDSVLYASQFLLKIVGYPTFFEDEYTLTLVGGKGVRMVYSCIGYGVMSFWAAFVIANNGSVFRKISWVFWGFVLLWTLNVLRIRLLLLAVNKNWGIPFNLDHHTLFNIVAYCFIFLLIYFYDKQKQALKTVSLI